MPLVQLARDVVGRHRRLEDRLLGPARGGLGRRRPHSFGQAGEWSSDDPAHSLRASLIEWVERGAAPGVVTATKYEGEGPARKAVMTRPLCAHPQEARYEGTGDANDATSFTCAAPAR